MGEQIRAELVAWDANGIPVVPTAGDVAWSSAGGALSGNGAGLEHTFSVTEPTNGVEQAIRATVGAATCTARVLALPAKTGPGVRVLVTDAYTGRPLASTYVRASDPQTGALQVQALTDANGVATLTPPTPRTSITAFTEGYEYVTFAGLDTATADDLRIALRRNPIDRHGGIAGTFEIPVTSDLQSGAAGLSFTAPWTALSLEGLAGRRVDTEISFGGQSFEVSFPVGMVGKLGTTPFKLNFESLGEAGTCTSTLGAGDVEQAIVEGACGTRTAWAFSTSVRLSQLPLSAIMDVEELEPVHFLALTPAAARNATSFIRRDVQYQRVVTPGAAGAPDFSDVSHYAPLQPQFDAMPLGFAFAISGAPLPTLGGDHATELVALGGVFDAHGAFVPLGVAAGMNTSPRDQSIDSVDLAEGLVEARMAPAHSGLEGRPYVLSVMALAKYSNAGPTTHQAKSGYVHRFAGPLPWDPTGQAPIAAPGGFPAYPEGAELNISSTPLGSLGARTFRLAAPPTFAELLRVVITDGAQRQWSVYVSPADAKNGVALPDLGGLVDDRTRLWNGSGAPRSPFSVEALAVGAGTSSGTLETLAHRGGIELTTLGRHLEAFATVDYGRPLLQWDPSIQDGKSVLPGSSLELLATDLRVGVDGDVRVSFLNGTGDCNPVTLTNDPSGTGRLSVQIPNCTGLSVTAKAELVNAGTPMEPPVEATVSLWVR